MTKSKLSAVIIVISLLIGLCVGIVVPNVGNIKALTNGYKTVEARGEKLVPTESEGAYIYTIGPVDGYVGYISLSGELDSIGESVDVFFTDTNEQYLLAENGKSFLISKKGGDCYLNISSDAKYMHVAIRPNGEFELDSITANPTNIAFSITSIFVWSCGFVFAAIIVLCFTVMRKSITEYAEIAHKYRHLVSNLIVRDLKVKYRRSVLGFLWSILNPLLMALVINAVFQNLFRFDIEYFIVYYLTGSLIFNFVVESTTSSLVSVLGASALIKKVYIPKYIFPLEKCLFAFVNMLFSSFAVIIVIIIQKMPVHATALLFFFPMICALIFSLGLSLILASVNIFFRDIGHLYSVWTTAWLYLTPIIYPVSILPENLFEVIKFNPMYYYVSYFRDVVMYGTVPDLNTHLICIMYSLLFLVAGLFVFKKQQDKFILYI